VSIQLYEETKTRCMHCIIFAKASDDVEEAMPKAGMSAL
jgi:hypothetical protein